MGETVLFIVLIGLMVGCQIMIISIMWQRFTQRLRAQEPPNAILVIRSFGPDSLATARALARHTRLDLGEIDELVERRRPGPLPLPLASRQANLLAAELRGLGAEVEIQPRTDAPFRRAA